MRTIVFDTETTGLKPGNICQLAYIIEDDGSATRQQGYNFFFRVDYVEPGAERVHGFDVDMLAALSGGKVFSDHAAQIYGDFESCPLWVAHNFTFDNSFLTAELRKSGLHLVVEKQLCTMRSYTPILKLPSSWSKGGAPRFKYPNLTELITFFDISDSEISDFASKAFDTDFNGLNRHDARFDCAATYMCYKRGIEKNLLLIT